MTVLVVYNPQCDSNNEFSNAKFCNYENSVWNQLIHQWTNHRWISTTNRQRHQQIIYPNRPFRPIDHLVLCNYENTVWKQQTLLDVNRPVQIQMKLAMGLKFSISSNMFQFLVLFKRFHTSGNRKLESTAFKSGPLLD